MRREVKWFAEKMEEILARRDKERGSDGWKGEDVIWILGRIEEETKELEEALKKAGFANVEYATNLTFNERTIIIKESVDIANFCMMMADIINEY
jgi:NTP pyrophosphatase (non-canonical NTP hydrolase)